MDKHAFMFMVLQFLFTIVFELEHICSRGFI